MMKCVVTFIVQTRLAFYLELSRLVHIIECVLLNLGFELILIINLYRSPAMVNKMN